MLTATLLALGAAVLHASWYLAVKQSDGDRFISLWGQFFVAGVVCAVREGAVRFSPHFYNTADEMRRAVAVLERTA